MTHNKTSLSQSPDASDPLENSGIGDILGAVTAVNLSDHDDIYEMLVNMHDGLNDDASHKRNAKLILALINHIGDAQCIKDMIEMVIENDRKSA